MHKCLNLCFARKEIIHFIQYSGLKKRKNCVTISTTKKRENSIQKAGYQIFERLIKESNSDFKNLKNRNDVKT